MSADAFTLDPRLASETLAAGELQLCTVRVMDDARYPWLILVPRIAGAVEVLDLTEAQQDLLWAEVRLCATVLRTETAAHKLNIAALGNVIAQLHVHIIARFRDDPAWPKPVWGVHPGIAYSPKEAAAFQARIKHALGCI